MYQNILFPSYSEIFDLILDDALAKSAALDFANGIEYPNIYIKDDQKINLTPLRDLYDWNENLLPPLSDIYSRSAEYSVKAKGSSSGDNKFDKWLSTHSNVNSKLNQLGYKLYGVILITDMQGEYSEWIDHYWDQINSMVGSHIMIFVLRNPHSKLFLPKSIQNKNKSPDPYEIGKITGRIKSSCKKWVEKRLDPPLDSCANLGSRQEIGIVRNRKRQNNG